MKIASKHILLIGIHFGKDCIWFGANIYVSDLIGQNTLFSQGELPQENNSIHIGSGIVILIVMIIILRMVIQTFRK